MNYTQKKKIEQVKPTTLVVGIDIAKKKHVARAQDFRGIEYGEALVFNNDQEGLLQLLDWLKTLQEENKKEDIIVGMEPTGHYWLNLAILLKEYDIKVVLVNPYHVKRSKELDDNSPTKNDKKDARVIAQLVKDGRYSVPNIPEGIYAELRVAMTLREGILKDIQRVKGRIHRWLDKYFPEFFQVFKSFEGKTALMTLQLFPLPQDINKRTTVEIVSDWKKGVKRAVGIKRAQRLKEAATQSIGITLGVMMAKKELEYLLHQYEQITRQLEELETEIEKMLIQIPGAKEMQSVPGVGAMTVAGFISEVGDITKYKHPRQIQKLAGLNLKENSSGQHKGRTRITKRGRPKLRSLLYRVVMPLVAKNNEFRQLHEYYTIRQDNPLKKKQSMIALACKLIRIFYALGKKQVEYDGEKLMKDIRSNQTQMVA